jgi:hypothetical protein
VATGGSSVRTDGYKPRRLDAADANPLAKTRRRFFDIYKGDEMSEQPRYMVSGYEPDAGGGSVVFTFVPKGPQQERGLGGIPKRVPQFIVTVRGGPDALAFDWSGSPDDPGAAGPEIEGEVRTRMQERTVWIDRVNELVTLIHQWATELGWSTRFLGKKLDDARVGTHRVPALLMQADTVRIIVEPIGRSAPGAEGVVDLYLMPGYDDIARRSCPSPTPLRRRTRIIRPPAALTLPARGRCWG